MLADPLSHVTGEEERCSLFFGGHRPIRGPLIVLEVLEDIELHHLPPSVRVHGASVPRAHLLSLKKRCQSTPLFVGFPCLARSGQATTRQGCQDSLGSWRSNNQQKRTPGTISV